LEYAFKRINIDGIERSLIAYYCPVAHSIRFHYEFNEWTWNLHLGYGVAYWIMSETLYRKREVSPESSKAICQ